VWRSKKFTVITVLAAASIIVLMLIGGGCAQAGDSDDSQTETEKVEIEEPDDVQSQIPPEGRRPQMNLDKVAEILGIDQQEVEDAFTQARSQMADDTFLAPREERSSSEEGWSPPEEWSREDSPFGESPPEWPSEGRGSPAGGLLPEALLARMAEILNIGQQTLEDAFAQAQSADGAQ
jgi:hypothetical protein